MRAERVIMVGDSAKDDVVSGNRAGAVTVLLDSGRTEKWVEEFGVETSEGSATLCRRGYARVTALLTSLDTLSFVQTR